MELTLIGVVLIPLTLVALLLPNIWTLSWVIFVSVLEAAAIINFGGSSGFGLQPGYFAAIMFMGKIAAIAIWNGSFRYDKSLLPLFLPLIGFCLWAVLSAATIPTLLAGLVEVHSPRDGISVDSLTLLAPRSTNVTQPAYAILLCVFWFFATNIITQAKEIKPVIGAFIASGILVIVIGFYEVLSHYTFFPFPEEFFHNSAGRSLVNVQVMFGIRRMASTFAEPSRFAAWMAGFLPFITIYYLGLAKSLPYLLLAILAFVAMMMSTSTTAYAVVAVFAGWIVIRHWPTGWVVTTRFQKPYFFWWLAMVSISVAAIVVFMASGLGRLAVGVLESSIFAKLATNSAVSRFTTDYHAVQTFWATGGLGVGWGSFRASSLLTTILVNAGLIGMFFLWLFGVSIWRWSQRARSLATLTQAEATRISALSWAVAGVLLAGAISSPDLANISIWINLSMLSGLLLRCFHGHTSVHETPPLRLQQNRRPPVIPTGI